MIHDINQRFEVNHHTVQYCMFGQVNGDGIPLLNHYYSFTESTKWPEVQNSSTTIIMKPHKTWFRYGLNSIVEVCQNEIQCSQSTRCIYAVARPRHGHRLPNHDEQIYFAQCSSSNFTKLGSSQTLHFFLIIMLE